LEGAVAGQMQCLVRWPVAWRALFLRLTCCTSSLMLIGERFNYMPSSS
jgi:hypothetical protein